MLKPRAKPWEMAWKQARKPQRGAMAEVPSPSRPVGAPNRKSTYPRALPWALTFRTLGAQSKAQLQKAPARVPGESGSCAAESRTLIQREFNESNALIHVGIGTEFLHGFLALAFVHHEIEALAVMAIFNRSLGLEVFGQE